MKTYSRKRLIQQELEGVLDMCRLCLCKPQESVPIFKDGQDVCAVLSMRIMICVGLEMTYEDFLPNKICIDCYQELERYYKFRRKCEESYHKLKAHVSALKEKEKSLAESGVDDYESREISKIPLDDDVKHLIKNEEEQLVTVPPAPGAPAQEMINSHGAHEALEINDNVEGSQHPVELELSPDISTFLRTVLLELGILQQREEGLQLQQLASLELETGAGEQLELELVEEDEDNAAVDAKSESSPQAQPESLEAENELVIEPFPKQNCAKTGKKNAWCSVCGRVFSSASSARRHAAVHAPGHSAGHSAGRPAGHTAGHSCPQCGRQFTQRAARDRHLLVHLEPRPHGCGACGASYTQARALRAHARSHAPAHARALLLHRCSLCERRFLHASGLSRHMMTHAGRTFECATCRKVFTDRSSVLRHIRACHTRHDAATSARQNVGSDAGNGGSGKVSS